ncbi:MAG: peptide ABC transporter permease [Candidatus Muproteobacteria bacterium RBG_16_65_34]|uniref:Peptide ABC transporter permease n=1 Tax=Candidatus Muproteobacteria bacterium RBG_16_65_34 TaxID=1817760 RepID=A0A1F6TMI1_9PROT|nr:MAG: peptide ABC transporter permease [Candidatus Muproteobacteria bacterium RBG_16_65_34]
MPFQPVFLWTDVLIYVLLAAAAGFGVYAARHEHLRAPWRQIARRPLAMVALVALAAYVAAGLLDSVHFRERLANGGDQYSAEVLSLLDKLAAPLRSRVEKTYSAPFAAHAYTKETVEYPDGRRVRAYPRLVHGGAHLKDPDERGADIGKRAALATAAGGLVWLALVAAFVALRRVPGEAYAAAARRLARGADPIPWRAILVTAGVLIVLAANAGYLSLYYHILGTDQVGLDVFYKSLKSVRTGLVIGTLTTLVMLPFAVLFGVMAGYFRGWVDDVIQYVYTTLSSIPSVLLIAAAILSLQVYMANHPEVFDNVAARADVRLLFLCVILGVTSWTSLCRLLRGETLKLREADYVQAAQALGASHLAVMARHVLPNIMHIVLITVVLDFSGLVLAEAVLSYVGVGVDPTTESWGNMINGARLEMAREPMVWWSLTAAFGFMFVLVLAANLFSDAVRDAFDPRLRR